MADAPLRASRHLARVAHGRHGRVDSHVGLAERHSGLADLQGGLATSRAISFPNSRTPGWATVDRPRVYTAWGGSTEISNYDDSCRTSVEASNQADVRIIVDPRVTNLGKESDYHLALRPGTDAAMAMGWAYIVVDHQLYDDLYVKKWTNAPFLVVEDMEPSGYDTVSTNGDPFTLKTRLLKASDLGRERQSPPLHGMGRPRGSTHLFR